MSQKRVRHNKFARRLLRIPSTGQSSLILSSDAATDGITFAALHEKSQRRACSDG